MNEITCDLCMDLIPLVQDGIASEDSRKAVEYHIETCGSCRALYDGKMVLSAESSGVFRKVQRKMRMFSLGLMLFGSFFGLGLTAGSDMFYNSLIMPVVGALGFFMFRWKAVYGVPLLLLVTHVVINFLGMMRGAEYLDFASLVVWTFIYSLFAAAGTTAAGLLCFAFRKEKEDE